MQKAVIYARFSCDNQTEQSIDGQRRVCTDFAAREGYEILGEYVDRAKSAKTDNRPEFLRMIEDAKKHQFAFIICYSVDRFSRNKYDSAIYKAKLKKCGVRVVYAVQPVSDSPEGRMMEGILETMAEYYSDELAVKTKRGMRESALKCQRTGSVAPLGFRWTAEKKLEIDEDSAAIPRLAFEMYGNGTGKKEIVEKLNSLGYRTAKGNKFQISSLEPMFANKKYIGIYCYGDDVSIEGGCPAIIDIDLWDKVQDKLRKTKKAPAAATAKTDYLLSGKLFCGYCGAPMCGESGTSRNGTKHHYYKCRTRKNGETCQKKNELKDYIEWYICENVIALLNVSERQELLAEKVVAAYVEFFGVSGVGDIEKRLKSVNKKISNVVDMIAETGNKALMPKLEDLQFQQEEIEDELKVAKISAGRIPTKSDVITWFGQFKNVDICEPSARKQIIDIFVSSVYLFDDHMIINFNFKNTTSQVAFEEIREYEKSLDDCGQCSSFIGQGEPYIELLEHITIIHGVLSLRFTR